MESRRGVPQTVETSLNFHLSLAGAGANSWDSRLGEFCVWKAPRSIDPASLKMIDRSFPEPLWPNKGPETQVRVLAYS